MQLESLDSSSGCSGDALRPDVSIGVFGCSHPTFHTYAQLSRVAVLPKLSLKPRATAKELPPPLSPPLYLRFSESSGSGQATGPSVSASCLPTRIEDRQRTTSIALIYSQRAGTEGQHIRKEQLLQR